MTHAVTVREPEFTDHERVALFASHGYEHAAKSGTGHPLSDATDPASQGKWAVPLPTLDFAQDALNKAQAVYKEQYPNADMSALLWRVERD